MTSYGKTLVADKLIAKEINWKTFNPPLTGAGGDQNLASVLAVGNDANDQNIVNVGDIECTKLETDLCEATTVDATTVTCTDVTCENMNVNTNLSVEDLTVNDELFHKAIKPKTGVIASIRTNDFDSEDVTARERLLAQTANVSLGATTMYGNLNMTTPGADIYDIVNGGNITCQSTKTISAGNVTASTQVTTEKLTANSQIEARNAELGAQLPATTFYSTEPVPVPKASIADGILRSTSVIVDNDIATSTPAIVMSEFPGVTGTGAIACNGLISAGQILRAPLIDIIPGDGVPPEVEMGINGQFNGTLTGSPATGHCVFTNCDFRSGTNLFNSSAQEQYEWMSCWTNARTNFPPPDGWRPYTPPQIPSPPFVIFDFDQGRNPGWRFFAPQSDSDCQIDPDDKMGLNEGEYVHAPDNNLAWKYAFYGSTAPTTIASHASQIVEFQFPVTQYGYGRIYMALAYQAPPYTDVPQILNNTFRLVMEHEGTALATNPRLNGPITMRWYIPSTFPTNGTSWRIFPVCRTDDNETTKGRMKIVIGDGQPLNGCNPGDPPDFTPPDENAMSGQLLLRGYPIPSTFYDFPDPPGQV